MKALIYFSIFTWLLGDSISLKAQELPTNNCSQTLASAFKEQIKTCNFFYFMMLIEPLDALKPQMFQSNCH
jgi:hypothetical protein